MSKSRRGGAGGGRGCWQPVLPLMQLWQLGEAALSCPPPSGLDGWCYTRDIGERRRSEFPHAAATVTVITNLPPPTRVLFSVIGLSQCPDRRNVMSRGGKCVRAPASTAPPTFYNTRHILRTVTFVFLLTKVVDTLLRWQNYSSPLVKRGLMSFCRSALPIL